MKLIRAILRSFRDIYPIVKLVPSLVMDIFNLVLGIAGLVMTVLLFPVLVWRNYK